jgi:hypothetical protein
LSSFCYMLIVGNRVFQCVFLGLVLNLSHYVYMWYGATCRTPSSGHLSMLKTAGWLFTICKFCFAGSLSHGHLFHISVFSYFTNIKLDKRFRFKMDFFLFYDRKPLLNILYYNIFKLGRTHLPFMTRVSHYKPWGGALTTLLCNFLIESQF